MRTDTSTLGMVDVVASFVDLAAQCAALFRRHAAVTALIVSLLMGLRFAAGTVSAAFRRAEPLALALLGLYWLRFPGKIALKRDALDMVGTHGVPRVAPAVAWIGRGGDHAERQQN